MTEDEQERVLKDSAAEISHRMHQSYGYPLLAEAALETFVSRMTEIEELRLLHSVSDKSATGKSVRGELVRFGKLLDKVVAFSVDDKLETYWASEELVGRGVTDDSRQSIFSIRGWLDEAKQIRLVLDDVVDNIDPASRLNSDLAVYPDKTSRSALVGRYLPDLYALLYPDGIIGGTDVAGELNGPLYQFVKWAAEIWDEHELTPDAIRKHMDR